MRTISNQINWKEIHAELLTTCDALSSKNYFNFTAKLIRKLNTIDPQSYLGEIDLIKLMRVLSTNPDFKDCQFIRTVLSLGAQTHPKNPRNTDVDGWHVIACEHRDIAAVPVEYAYAYALTGTYHDREYSCNDNGRHVTTPDEQFHLMLDELWHEQYPQETYISAATECIMRNCLYSPFPDLMDNDWHTLVTRVVFKLRDGSNKYAKVGKNDPKDEGCRRVTNLIKRLEAAIKNTDTARQKKEIAGVLSAAILYQGAFKELARCIHRILALPLVPYSDFCDYAQRWHVSCRVTTEERMDIEYELSDLSFNQTESLHISELCTDFVALKTKVIEGINEYMIEKTGGEEGVYRSTALRAALIAMPDDALRTDAAIQKQFIQLICAIVLCHKGKLGSAITGRITPAMVASLEQLQIAYGIPWRNLERTDERLTRPSKHILQMNQSELRYLAKLLGKAIEFYLNENNQSISGNAKPHDVFGMMRAQKSLDELNRIQAMYPAIFSISSSSTCEDEHTAAASSARTGSAADANVASARRQLNVLLCAIVHYSSSTQLKERIVHFTGQNILDSNDAYKNEYLVVATELQTTTAIPDNNWFEFKNKIIAAIVRFQKMGIGSPLEKALSQWVLEKIKAIDIAQREDYVFATECKKRARLINLIYKIICFEKSQNLASMILCFIQMKQNAIGKMVSERSKQHSVNSNSEYNDEIPASPELMAKKPENAPEKELPHDFNVMTLKESFLTAIKDIPSGARIKEILNELISESGNSIEDQTKLALLICAIVLYAADESLRYHVVLSIELSVEQVKTLQQKYNISDELCTAAIQKIKKEIYLQPFIVVNNMGTLEERLQATATAILEDKNATSSDRAVANNLKHFLENAQQVDEVNARENTGGPISENAKIQALITLANAVLALHNPLVTKHLHAQTGLDDFQLLYLRDSYHIHPQFCKEKSEGLQEFITDYTALYNQVKTALTRFQSSGVGNEAQQYAAAELLRILNNGDVKISAYIANRAVLFGGRLKEAMLDFIRPVFINPEAANSDIKKQLNSAAKKLEYTSELCLDMPAQQHRPNKSLSEEDGSTQELQATANPITLPPIDAAFKENLKMAAACYIRDNQSGLSGTGAVRARNLSANAELQNVATLDGQKELVVLAAAVVLFTPSHSNDLRDKILMCTGFTIDQIRRHKTQLNIENRTCKHMATALAPPALQRTKQALFSAKQPVSTDEASTELMMQSQPQSPV